MKFKVLLAAGVAALIGGAVIAQTITIPTLPLASMSNLDLMQVVPGGQPAVGNVYIPYSRLGAYVMSSSYGSAPALTSCGTSPTITGNDIMGTVTMGTGSPTGCVITFAVARNSAPYCMVVWQATPLAAQHYTTSATAITLVQTGTSSNVIDYFCPQQAGF